ncbi:DMT family transporter [Paenibacillus arenilitoris]|uniref:DMT family transporter n=1 Tax=Paenibacillus arenilitoris TaxID=2772299 RepID=A0A927CM30_9BACL|nr:DMT family transporter [Paenibacillus arenilitoris]MBD2870539.1 DMT family transporter [Paenibacillus arenilitoris]
MSNNKHLLPHLGFLAVYLLWGINISSMKIGGQEWDPVMFNGLRYACIVPMLWLMAYMYSRRSGISLRMEKKDLGLILFLGVLSAVGMEVMLSYALQFSNAANGSVLGRGFMPVLTVIIALALREIRVTPRILIGLPLAFASVIVIVAGGGGGLHFGGDTLRGDLLLLLRSLFGAIYLILMSRLTSRYPLMLLIAWEMSAGAAVLLPYVLWKGDAAFYADISATGWTSLAYTALLATVVGFTLHNWSLARLGPFKASFYGYILPITAAVSGYYLLKESITVYQVLGGIGVLAAMYLVQRDRQQKSVQTASREAGREA